jgi:hypothetical protein
MDATQAADDLPEEDAIEEVLDNVEAPPVVVPLPVDGDHVVVHLLIKKVTGWTKKTSQFTISNANVIVMNRMHFLLCISLHNSNNLTTTIYQIMVTVMKFSSNVLK